MSKAADLNDVLELAKRLSTLDKVRLIERVAPELERELQAAQPVPRKSLRGLWRGLNVTDKDITKMRCEMWRNFPRSDF